ncbi:anti-sigma factor RsbA family regulatory protein [Geodermatophilus sp. SYSU D01186]
MTSTTGPADLHAALLYRTAEELVSAAVPFLADGLAVGETAVLACRNENSALLAEALGHDDRVLVLPREGIYTRTAHAIATFRRVVRRQVAAGAPGVWLFAEVPVDQSGDGWHEWHRCEAILNVALGPLPLSIVCAYDRRELSDAIRGGIEETHPALMTPAGPVPNLRYLDPATVLRRTPAPLAGRAEDTPPTLQLTDLTDVTRMPELRARVRAALDGSGEPGQLRSRFAAAVAEVLLNALRHGRPPVAVRLWATPTRLECTVTDCGDGFDDPLVGYTPPGPGFPPAGAGLWLVRGACDTLETFRTRAGFAVHLATRLPGSDTAPTPSSEAAPVDTPAARADRARADARELARRFGGRLH